MTGFRIKNGTSLEGLKIFVSSYTGGNDSWYDLPSSFGNDSKCHWGRNGWEVIVIHDPKTEQRRGWYMQTFDSGVVECTFLGFDKDMTV
ncbi:hypothetical protein BJ165DRAFT_1327429, partial [Panaeolus papilionaceus]